MICIANRIPKFRIKMREIIFIVCQLFKRKTENNQLQQNIKIFRKMLAVLKFQNLLIIFYQNVFFQEKKNTT